jgi:hypothetical protein
MLHKWSDEVENARSLVEKIVKRIDEGIQFLITQRRGFKPILTRFSW